MNLLLTKCVCHSMNEVPFTICPHAVCCTPFSDSNGFYVYPPPPHTHTHTTPPKNTLLTPNDVLAAKKLWVSSSYSTPLSGSYSTPLSGFFYQTTNVNMKYTFFLFEQRNSLLCNACTFCSERRGPS